MLNEGPVDPDSTPLGHDYDENIEDYENGKLSAGDNSDDECEEMKNVRQEEVAVFIYGLASPKPEGENCEDCKLHRGRGRGAEQGLGVGLARCRNRHQSNWEALLAKNQRQVLLKHSASHIDTGALLLVTPMPLVCHQECL
jgi:hypothetical protein